MKRTKLCLVAPACAFMLLATPTPSHSGAAIVNDPLHTIETVIQSALDAESWYFDHFLSQMRNLQSLATNSIELSAVLDSLRNSEMDAGTAAQIKAMVGEFTMGAVDLNVDIGDIKMDEPVLIEVMSEKLAEAMQYQQAVNSRVEGVAIKIRETFPDVQLQFADIYQERWEKDAAWTAKHLHTQSAVAGFDTAVAAMKGSQELQMGLLSADELLLKAREGVEDEELGLNAMTRRIMQTNIVAAENARAQVEATTMLTDLLATDLAREASDEAAALGEGKYIDEVYNKRVREELEDIDTADSTWDVVR